MTTGDRSNAGAAAEASVDVPTRSGTETMVRRILGPPKGPFRRTAKAAIRPFQIAAYRARGRRFARKLSRPQSPIDERAQTPREASNRLLEYFDAHVEGPGIWKWRHYFDVYDRHFSRFVGQEAHVLEIGIYSGGSFGMWRDYFGPRCHLYGVDIEEVCRVYERDSIGIFIGDQGDPAFWRDFCSKVPKLDIVIDDGGHLPHQQIVTMECLLPHLQLGGVYVCEDITHVPNGFESYVASLAAQLNDLQSAAIDTAAMRSQRNHATSRGLRRFGLAEPTGLQQVVHSVHRYPYITVIERPPRPVQWFESEKHGTEWQPFLDWATPGFADA